MRKSNNYCEYCIAYKAWLKYENTVCKVFYLRNTLSAIDSQKNVTCVVDPLYIRYGTSLQNVDQAICRSSLVPTTVSPPFSPRPSSVPARVLWSRAPGRPLQCNGPAASGPLSSLPQGSALLPSLPTEAPYTGTAAVSMPMGGLCSEQMQCCREKVRICVTVTVSGCLTAYNVFDFCF